MAALALKQSYSRENVRRMLSVSERQLRSWERGKLIGGGAHFTFADIIALRTLLKLREKHVATRRIMQVVSSLRRRLSHIKQPLSELTLNSEGGSISVQLAGSKMDALTGQLHLNFDPTVSSATTLLRKPEPKRAVLEKEAEGWFQHGLSLEETGAPAKEVLEAYEKAVELNPEAAGALVNLGTIYYRMGKLARAEELYHRAAKSDPEYALAEFNLGNLYDEKGDPRLAREHYLAAVKLDPRYADAYFNLALVSEKTGEQMRAVGYWSAYLKLDTDSSWAEVARKQLDRLKQVTLVHSR